MRDLGGKRVLITGGARGIGLALSRRLAREGAVPLVVDVDAAALGEAADTLRGEGATVGTYRADVTDRDGVRDLPRRVHDDGGPIDVLVNNAGVVYGGPFLDVPVERHELTYAVNTVGLVAMTHAFLPDLIGRREGHLVNIASASGFVGLPYASTYASSKWSVIGFSESIRLELGEQGHDHVTVTTVCPSYVATELFEGARPPRLTRLLDPARLADLIVRAILRERAMVVAPLTVNLLLTLRGLLPRRAVDVVSRWVGSTTGMLGWKGRSED